jgi:glycosyltransferase involved in cell wall biosynthesis
MAYSSGNNSPGVLTAFRKFPGLLKNQDDIGFPGISPLELVRVSAVIITFNEEAIIKETLNRLYWCNEIIIIDSGSTDKTVEICKEFGCLVFYRSFNGFGEQKKFGISKANNDWVLCLDADEVLSDSLITEIRSEINKVDTPYAGFAFPRNLVFMGKIFKYGKEANSPIIRLFNKQNGNWDGACVHEKVILNGPVKKLNNKLLHYSYHDYSQFLSKINLYSTLGAKKLYALNAHKNKLIVLLGLPFNFFKYYIIDRNFLNGYRGFAWSLLNTIYHFVKYLKLNEIRQSSSSTAF